MTGRERYFGYSNVWRCTKRNNTAQDMTADLAVRPMADRLDTDQIVIFGLAKGVFHTEAHLE
jgi:hypothetical protein